MVAMPDAEIPNFRDRKEIFRFWKEEPIPPVDPEDLRRRWNIKPHWTSEAVLAAQSHEADSAAVSRRDGMIRMLTHFNDGQLLAPWHHGEELDDAVFRVAAAFPMPALRTGCYKIAGEEQFGFDPNSFVQLCNGSSRKPARRMSGNRLRQESAKANLLSISCGRLSRVKAPLTQNSKQSANP
jgi:hypothetical protein